MKLKFLFILFFGCTAALSAIEKYDVHDADKYYQLGIEQKKTGTWKQALNIWLEGVRELSKQNQPDPRIGIAFIELATEKLAGEFYERACEAYFWGLARCDLKKYEETVKDELARIEPIVNKEQCNAWNSLLKKNDPMLNQQLIDFWEKNDPTPSTVLNERLIEHWERIAYARKHFRKTSGTAYGTDDRGLYYVKYGAPDRIHHGMLGNNNALIKSWTEILIVNIDARQRSARSFFCMASSLTPLTSLSQSIFSRVSP